MRQVPKEEAKAYAEEAGLLFFETSAKTGEMVSEVFTEIGEFRNAAPYGFQAHLLPCNSLALDAPTSNSPACTLFLSLHSENSY